MKVRRSTAHCCELFSQNHGQLTYFILKLLTHQRMLDWLNSKVTHRSSH